MQAQFRAFLEKSMMKVSKAKVSAAAGMAGVAALVAACIPCCISLASPILAWLGLASFGAIATGWYFAAVGVFALGAAVILYARFRRGAHCQIRKVQSTCGCGTACKS